MKIHVQLTFEDFAAAQRAHFGVRSWWVTLVFGSCLLLVLGAPLLPSAGPRLSPTSTAARRRASTPQVRLPANYRRTLLVSAILAWLASVLVLGLPLFLLAYLIWVVVRRIRSGTANRPWDRPGPEQASRFSRAMNWIVPVFIYLAAGFVMAVRIRAIVVRYQLLAALGGRPDPSAVFELLIGTVPMLIIFGGLIFFQKPLTRILRRASWRAQTNLQRPTSYEFNADGMIEAHELARSEYRWENFPGFRESRELFLLYPSPLMFHILPKRAFANAAEVDEFRMLLHENIRKTTYAFPVGAANTLPSAAIPIANGGETSS